MMKCPDCGEMVNVTDGVYDRHSATTPEGAQGTCDGSGKSCDAKAVEAPTDAAKTDSMRRQRVNRFERLDASALKAPVRTDAGYLRVEGRIARVGIQEYRDSVGKMRRELRLPDEVFDAASLASFQQVPVTNQHPPGMLTSDNAKKYAVGAVGENVRRDGDYVAAPLVLYDAEAIQAAEAGRSQLSNGYSCTLDETQDAALTKKWGQYDSIQRDIRGNHCALVDVARAGPEARLRLDAGDAATGAQFVRQTAIVLPLITTEEFPIMATLKVGSMTFEVNDANCQAAVDREISVARKDGDDKAIAATIAKDAAEKQRAEAIKSATEMQAKLDALEAQAKRTAAEVVKRDGAEIAVGDFSDEAKREAFLSAAISKAAASRATLVIEARRHLGANEKLDEKADLEIKRLVVQKLNKDVKLEGRTPDYIQARYDAEIEQVSKSARRPVDLVREAVTLTSVPASDGRVDDQPATDPEDARRRMVERTLAANRKR